MRVGAVAFGNDVAAARVLAASLARHHPDWKLSVLVMPGLRPEVRRGEEPFEVLLPSEIEAIRDDAIVYATPQAPLAALMRPALVSHLLGDDGEPVLLLSPNAALFGPIDDLLGHLGDAPALLARRVGAVPDDGRRPDGRDLADAGQFEDGLVVVRDRRFADWWLERGFETADLGASLRVTRRDPDPQSRLQTGLLDTAERVFADLAILDDPAYGVSHWNLHERDLASARLMLFDGFRADRPWWLSEHADRTLVLDDPKLTEIAAERALLLREAGWLRTDLLAAERPTLPNGLILDARLRKLHAEAIDRGEDFGDIFAPAGADAFSAWVREPGPAGRMAGINRYAHNVWRERADLGKAYPDLDGTDGEQFAGWLWVHGRPELHLQPQLLPPPPDWVPNVGRPAVPGVVVTGFMEGRLGLGQAARGYVSALQAADVPVGTRSVATGSSRVDEHAFEALALDDEHDVRVDLACVNPEHAHLLTEGDGPPADYRIAHWAWETDVVPEYWQAAFDHVDEVWVISSYIAENLSRAATVPVVVVPLPVTRPPTPPATLLGPEIPADAFAFVFAFDFFSVFQRKNPLAVIEAFKRAFSPGEGPVLVLKTHNSDARPEPRERLRHAIGDRPDIVWIDRGFSEVEMAALFARADAYVSLHRSEGFGLTLAESMALGKPVIATGFSGNTDFMTDRNSWLVDYEIVPVGPDAEHYPPDGVWAEPSIEHAAAAMREVFDNPEEARRRGERAARDVQSKLSPEAVGTIARARLERIAAAVGSGVTGRRLPYPLSELQDYLRFDLRGRDRSGARGLARRVLLRSLRPYTTAERALDQVVAASLERLHLEIEGQRSARERDRERIARLERRIAELNRRAD
jgi:glycosyltransferase involved in cell wall biosynthesis